MGFYNKFTGGFFLLLGYYTTCTNLHAQHCIVSHEGAFINTIENVNTLPLINTREAIIVPIVVHILWKYPEDNISREQVLSQIDALNKDFSATNSNLSGVPEAFSPLIANANIQFCLASKDEFGQPTSGITRTNTTMDNIGTTKVGDEWVIHQSHYGGVHAWNQQKYINIWVGRCAAILGRATMPTIPLAEDDGIVIDPRSFGTIGTASTGNYNKGKTLTHELGHYFGLLHTWGSIPDECSEDDGIIDTPQQYSNYVGCPTFPQYSCNTSDMFMNFMDYCHDECLRMFTPQQVERMKQVLFIYRTELLTSKNTVCQQENYSKNEITEKINVFPNPAFDKLAISFDFNLFQSIPIEIFNAQGKMVYQTLAFPPTVLTLPTTNWVAGAYIIRIKINSNNFIKKFIKK